MSEHRRIFWILGVFFGILGVLIFIWWWHSGAEASEGEVKQITEQEQVSNLLDSTVTLIVTPTLIISNPPDVSPTQGFELYPSHTDQYTPPLPTNSSLANIATSYTSIPTITSISLPTPTSNPTPIQVASPTPASTSVIHPISLSDLTTNGVVDLAHSAVGTTVATFGTPTIGSYLFANQLSFLLPPLSPLTTVNWLNFRLRLSSNEETAGFDDPALVILLDDTPLFALSAADWQRLVPMLNDGWWTLSLYLPPIWDVKKVTVLGGDNGDLEFPTVVDLELVGLSEQPLYPFIADQTTMVMPSQLYWQSVAGSVLLTPDPNAHASPFYLASNIDSLDSTLPSFYQTDQLLWLSSNLLYDGALLIADHPYFHSAVQPDDSPDSPIFSLPLSLWPLAAIHTIPLLPID